jgi:hypothetical protein
MTVTFTPITLATLQNDTTATTAINANFFAVANGFSDVVSLDGTNTMRTSIDMNSNRILNLPNPLSVGEPVTLGVFNAFLTGSGQVPAGGQAGYILMKNSSASFDTIWSPLTGFPSAGALTGTETVIGIQSSNNVQITTQSIANLAFTGSALSALPSAVAVGPTDLFYIVQSGVDKKVAGSVISSLTNLTVGTSVIGGGTSGRVLYDNAGILGELPVTGSGNAVLATSPIISNTLTVTGGTVTSNAPVLNLTQTWNNAGVVFQGILLNVTNTASAGSSPLLDLQVGGLSWFRVVRAGVAGSAEIRFSTNSASYYHGFADTGTNSFSVLANGNTIAGFALGGLVSPSFNVAFMSVSNNGLDTMVYREAANIIAFGNASNAHSIRAYNTTDTLVGVPTNYERGTFDWATAANVLTIGSQKGGTGSSRDVSLVSGSTEMFRLLGAGGVKFSNAASFSANGAVATVLGSVGPTGSHTTVQTWLTFVDSGGVTRYVPCF